MSIADLRELPQSVPLDSVKMSPEALSRLLDEMDWQAKVPPNTRRRHERLTYRCKGLIVTVDQSGYKSTFAVPIRNISKGGISFLHRAMIHVGSFCHLQIRTPANRWVEANGKVVRARYVKTGVHEIGLRFEEEIDATPFVQPTRAKETPG